MADVKTVRMTNSTTGVTVVTTEENAGRLSGYEPAKPAKKPAAKPAADSE